MCALWVSMMNNLMCLLKEANEELTEQVCEIYYKIWDLEQAGIFP